MRLYRDFLPCEPPSSLFLREGPTFYNGALIHRGFFHHEQGFRPGRFRRR